MNPWTMREKQLKRVIAIAALATLPLTVDALDLTGLPAALAEKVTVARINELWHIDINYFTSVDGAGTVISTIIG